MKWVALGSVLTYLIISTIFIPKRFSIPSYLQYKEMITAPMEYDSNGYPVGYAADVEVQKVIHGAAVTVYEFSFMKERGFGTEIGLPTASIRYTWGQDFIATLDFQGKKISTKEVASPSKNVHVTADYVQNKPAEDGFPQVVSTVLTYTAQDTGNTFSMSSKDFGELWNEAEVVAFSPDEQFAYVWLRAPKGGDFVDRTMLIRQPISGEKAQVLLQNPDPIQGGYDAAVQSYTVTIFSGVSDTQKALVLQRMQYKGGTVTSTSLWTLDLATGTLVQKVNTSGQAFYHYSPGRKFALRTNSDTAFVVDLVNGAEKQWELRLENGYGILALSDDGRYIAIGGNRNGDDIVTIKKLGTSLEKETIRRQVEPSLATTGQVLTHFINFMPE